jgi:hypothetical protein
MSAYVVEDKTINRIVSWLWQDGRNNRYTMHRLEKIGLTKSEDIGRALLNMNIDAVGQRYQIKDNPGATRFYRHGFELVTNRYQALKSLHCFLYQCSEGDVPETELYKIMSNYEEHLVWDTISEIPQYERAEWA